MASGLIDYQALAAALLQAGLRAPVSVDANNTTAVNAGPAVAKPAVKTTVKGGPAVEKPIDQGGPVRGSKVQFSGAGSSGSGASWDEMVEEELSVGSDGGVLGTSDTESVSGGSVTYSESVPVAGNAVRGVVQFGGYSENYEVAVSTSTASKSGYYATVVRSPNAVALKRAVEKLSGAKVPKGACEALAICGYTAGVMPDLVAQGKQRLRVLAAVGDASITLALVVHKWAAGENVESAQAARSKLTSNTFLKEVMVRTGLVRYVAFPPGVDPSTTTGTATAFEAIVGALTLYCAPNVVKQFLVAVGLLC